MSVWVHWVQKDLSCFYLINCTSWKVCHKLHFDWQFCQAWELATVFVANGLFIFIYFCIYYFSSNVFLLGEGILSLGLVWQYATLNKERASNSKTETRDLVKGKGAHAWWGGRCERKMKLGDEDGEDGAALWSHGSHPQLWPHMGPNWDANGGRKKHRSYPPTCRDFLCVPCLPACLPDCLSVSDLILLLEYFSIPSNNTVSLNNTAAITNNNNSRSRRSRRRENIHSLGSHPTHKLHLCSLPHMYMTAYDLIRAYTAMSCLHSMCESPPPPPSPLGSLFM